MKMPTPREKPRRYMSAAEYDRYVSTTKRAGDVTMRGTRYKYDPRDPSDFNEDTQIKVATGGRIEKRARIFLNPDFVKKGSGATNMPGSPKGTKDKGTNYKGYNKGTPSPSSYGKRP